MKPRALIMDAVLQFHSKHNLIHGALEPRHVLEVDKNTIRLVDFATTVVHNVDCDADTWAGPGVILPEQGWINCREPFNLARNLIGYALPGE